MKFGLNVIHVWNIENPAEYILNLAVAADKAGWEGLFLWDHITWSFHGPAPLTDPWTMLAGIATRTKNLRLGTIVAPLPRRRPQVVARQLVTLDHLSNGHAVLGVGLGGDARDYTAFGEKFEYKLLADKLDEALDVITGLWSGEAFTYHGKCYVVEEVTFLPKPIQEPRIPIWVGGESKGALKRASRFDGWVIGGPAPSANAKGFSLEQVSKAAKKIQHYRVKEDPFDIIYGMEFPEEENVLRETVRKADSVGVTWMLEGIYGLRYSNEQALERVRKGPPQID
ncbi:LLM class flavin-dependent oxidoreductase [Candidatus Bathyarchaeota archaeon]|nr:MAG: LLM class flavin-dependent oxidoreductase [Candidatus Bathyarchaeota archaeon]